MAYPFVSSYRTNWDGTFDAFPRSQTTSWGELPESQRPYWAKANTKSALGAGSTSASSALVTPATALATALSKALGTGTSSAAGTTQPGKASVGASSGGVNEYQTVRNIKDPERQTALDQNLIDTAAAGNKYAGLFAALNPQLDTARATNRVTLDQENAALSDMFNNTGAKLNNLMKNWTDTSRELYRDEAIRNKSLMGALGGTGGGSSYADRMFNLATIKESENQARQAFANQQYLDALRQSLLGKRQAGELAQVQSGTMLQPLQQAMEAQQQAQLINNLAASQANNYFGTWKPFNPVTDAFPTIGNQNGNNDAVARQMAQQNQMLAYALNQQRLKEQQGQYPQYWYGGQQQYGQQLPQMPQMPNLVQNRAAAIQGPAPDSYIDPYFGYLNDASLGLDFAGG